MARKTAIPSQQMERLKELYNQERDALVGLATAQGVVSSAEEGLRAAQRALREAQSGVDAAYQALVALTGPSVAAELTGRGRSGSRRARAHDPVGEDMARADGVDVPRGEGTSSASVGGAVG
jgi:hypothetical protein